jgi:CPA1 family monovalent cation:H+ antiporter
MAAATGGRRSHAGWRERLILGWSGMRGAITLAALLAVPVTGRGGSALAGRDDIIYIGFAVIIVTLVGQGMTLPLLVGRLHLEESPTVADSERQARIELTRAVLARIGSSSPGDPVPAEFRDGLRAQYVARLQRLQTATDDDIEPDSGTAVVAEAGLRQDLIAVQRQALLDLRAGGRIGVTTLRAIERDLDLEEARLS